MKVKRLKEIWKDIPGYEGYYQVSNLGRVRSIDREVVYRDGKKCLYKGRLLKPREDKNGYFQVGLSKLGKVKTFKVHRLVLEAFKGPCPEGMESCHKNGIKTDNIVYNLRWDTKVANQADSKRHGTNNGPKGERCGNAKLTEQDVVDIRTEYTKGNIIQEELGKQFGVHQVTIGNIVRRETWTHI